LIPGVVDMWLRIQSIATEKRAGALRSDEY